jgi:hypothetical protein
MEKYNKLMSYIKHFENTEEFKNNILLEFYELYSLNFKQLCKDSELNKDVCDVIIFIHLNDLTNLLSNNICYDDLNYYLKIKNHSIKDDNFFEQLIFLIDETIKIDIKYLINRKYIVKNTKEEM